MKEEELSNHFKKLLIQKCGIKEENIKIAPRNKSKIMDFNFIEPITNKYISLEAKTFNDTRSNSNYFLSLFGKIIKGRKLNENNESCKNKKVEYGFLFDKNNETIIRKYFSILDKDDWINFCKLYDLTLIYVCSNENFDVYNAQSFIEKFTVETNINAYFDDNTIEESEETDIYTLEMEGENHGK